MREHNILSLTKGYILISDTLPTFPESPNPGPLTCSVEDDSLTASNGRDTITAMLDEWRQIMLAHFPGNGVTVNIDALPGKTNRERAATKRIGRPKAAIPSDHSGLIRIISKANQQGCPFHKTGASGLYARRQELPAPYNGIGKHRLWDIVTGLLSSGQVESQKDGTLTVPGFPENVPTINR